MRADSKPMIPWLSLVLLLAAPAAAFWDEEEESPQVGIRRLSLRVAVRGRIATTTMDLVFVNYADDQQEAVYQWRMSPEAAVHDLALWVRGMRSPGSLYPRAAAKAIYEEIVSARRDPALVEYLGGGLWNLRVFPVPPGKTLKVQVAFTHLLPVEGNRLVYVAPRPTRACSAATAGELDFTATIRCPGGVKDVHCPDHAVGVERTEDPSGPRITVGFRKEDVALKDRIRIEITPGKAPPQVVAGHDLSDVFLTTLPPPKVLAPNAQTPRNVVLVLDTSASMRGDPMEWAIAGAWSILNALGDDDRFTVVLCGPEPRLWKDALVAGTDRNVGDAQRFIRDVEPAGGTDLAAALRAAAGFHKQDRPVAVFLVTDGWDLLTAAASRRPEPEGQDRAPLPAAPPCRVFALGVAGQVDELTRLAEISGGMAMFVYEHLAAKEAARALIRRAWQMRITEARIEPCTGKGEKQSDLTSVRDLAWSRPRPGEPIVLAGRRSQGVQGRFRVRLTAKVDGRGVEADWLVKHGPAGAASDRGWGGRGIRKLHAHLRAERMYGRLVEPTSRLEDVRKLHEVSVAHHIVTQGTALMVLEDDEECRERGIERGVTMLDEGEHLLEKEDLLKEDERRRPPSKQMQEHERRLRHDLRKLLDEGHYNKAVEVIHTHSTAAEWRYAFVTELALMREFAQIRLNAAEQGKPQEEKLAAYRGLSWEEIPAGRTPRQLVTTAAAHGIEIKLPALPGDKEARRILAGKACAPAADKGELRDALEWLRQTTGLEMHVRWEALARAGVGKDAKVKVDLKDATVERALRAILDAAGGEHEVGYRLEDGLVIVSTPTDLARVPVTRVYDARALLACLPCFDEAPAAWRRWQRGGDTWGAEGGGVFGGGIFEDDGGEADEGVVRVAGEAGDQPARIRHAGIVARVDGRMQIEPAAGERQARGIFEDESAYPVGPLYAPFPTRQRVAWKLLAMIGDLFSGGLFDPPSSRELYRGYAYEGLLVLRYGRDAHLGIRAVLRQVQAAVRADKLGDLFGKHWPESLFTRDARVEPWVLELLRRAGEGKLSRFSSVRVKQAAGRRLARVGGIWFDTSLARGAAIYTIARTGEAADAVRKTSPKLKECFAFREPVILAVDDGLALCLDEVGLRRADDPDVRSLLAALAAKGPSRSE